MNKHPSPPLKHILNSIEWIEEDIKGLNFDTFSNNRRVRQLVERNVEIISEASRRIPDVLKQQHKNIKWKEIAGIGNVLRHDYHEVIPSVLWDVVTIELKAIKETVQQILRDYS